MTLVLMDRQDKSWFCDTRMAVFIEGNVLFSCPQASISVSFNSLELTHVVNQLSDHSVPLSFVILRSVLPISHQPDFVCEAQDVGELFEEIQTVTLETIVPHQLLVRLFIHHIRIFLRGKNKTQFTIFRVNFREQ